MFWGNWAAVFAALIPCPTQPCRSYSQLSQLWRESRATWSALGSGVVKLREEEPAGSANGLVAVYNSSISAHPK
jgi:hypothetical protein